MDPLEWLARLADHIPTPADIAPTSTRTTPTGFAASGRARRSGATADEAEPPRRRRCSPTGPGSLPRCFRRIRSSGRRCGGPLKVVAYITDSLAICRSWTSRPHAAREATSRHPRRRPRAGGGRGPRDRGPTRLSCRAPPRASPHKPRGVRGQGSHGDHTRLQGARRRSELGGHPPTPSGGVGGRAKPLAVRSAFVGRRFTDLSVRTGLAARTSPRRHDPTDLARWVVTGQPEVRVRAAAYPDGEVPMLAGIGAKTGCSLTPGPSGTQ